MKLTVLGNNGTCPTRDGACSSYLLTCGNTNILLDAGNGSVAKLQHIISAPEIDIILISHLHIDHIADLFCLKYLLETKKSMGENIKKIALYLPQPPQWILDELSTNDIFDIVYIWDDMTAKVGTSVITFMPVHHMGAAFGMRIDYGGKKFVYSGDSASCDNLLRLAQNADIFLCESTIISGDGDPRTNHHMTALQAAALAKAAKARKLLLTHFFEPEKSELYEQAAQSIFTPSYSTKILQEYNV